MFYDFDAKLIKMRDEALSSLKGEFEYIDDIAVYNQQKVMHAFLKNKVSESHFVSSTGYGYGDRGREVIDVVFADIFSCEAALVRHNFVSGTHALTCALFGLLRPGDTLLSVTQRPYDTLHGVIFSNGGDTGSLADFGIGYRQVEFRNGKIDFDAVRSALEKSVKVVFIQRSKGYDPTREALACEDIEEICKFVKGIKKDVICMVDNCYGEFTQIVEPADAGADLAVGSLIKNPGGGMSLTGGYIAGKKDLVEKCAYRLTAPGVGAEVGATLGQNVNILKGIFMAPHVVKESLRTALFCARLFEMLGYEVYPKADEKRFDIIQSIKFNEEGPLVAFCQGIQKGSPIDAFVIPEPWDMPGYTSKVIMAAGGFTQGASIELSADAPIKEPYMAFLQGALTFESGLVGIMCAAQNLLDKGFIKLG